jgi:formamidopyrimidine-DNA glycosylase
MPELPDIVLYVEALKRHVAGQVLRRVRLLSPFVLRSVDPPVDALLTEPLRDAFRLGKRIVLGFGDATVGDDASSDDGLYLVIHLMIAGRLRWREAGQKAPAGPKTVLATLEFDRGTLFLTEASSKKRASLHVVRGREAVRALNPGGLEPMEATLDEFRDALTRESHTLKRALTDPHLFSGIGNAYSDEILHAARLSPLKLARSLAADEMARLYEAVRGTLRQWTDRLRAAEGGRFPENVTAFRGDMAVHGRFGRPCPACGRPVQRIVYAENECNYCAHCQTGGRLLADRSLSRLLKDDWPRRLDE